MNKLLKKIDKKFIKNIAINFGILLGVILILFIIAEVAARAIFSFSKEGATAIHLQIFEGSDKYGWEHHPNSLDYYGYGDPTPEVKINSLGFRDDEISIEKPENTKRIIVLGDSFTFGMGVSKPDIFTEILEEKLNSNSENVNYEVINTASIGYTIDNQYLLLKEKGLQLDPDMVILAFFTGNDVTELRRHIWETDRKGIPYKITDTEHYVDEEHRLRYKGEDEPVSYFLNFLDKRIQILQKKLGIYNDAQNEPTLTWPAFLDPDDPNGDSRVPHFWNRIDIVLENMKKELDEKGVKFLVMAIPMDVQTDKKYWNKYAQMFFDEDAYEKDRPQNKLNELTEKYGIDLIDLLPYFREAESNEWYYFEKADPHWTIKGHDLAANILFENLDL